VKKIAFIALIREVRIKSLRSGDKSTWITLEIDSPSDALITGLNSLHKADGFVGVAIAEGKDGGTKEN